MVVPSRRLRIEEKKAVKKIVRNIVFFLVSFVIFIFIGLPLMAKIILTISSFRKEKPSSNISASLVLPPILDSIPQATNSSRIRISGYSDKETSVKIFINNKEVTKILADKDGKFISTRLFLSEGLNTISAIAVKNQKESSPSSSLTITYKKTPPKLEINSPKKDETFFEEEKEITITGETDPESKVMINDRFVIVDQNGNFSYLVNLSEGENNFKITATDIAGNQTKTELKVFYEK